MAYAFEGFQNFGKDQLEAISASSSTLSRNLQTIVTESSEYSKKTLENGSAFFEKLLVQNLSRVPFKFSPNMPGPFSTGSLAT